MKGDKICVACQQRTQPRLLGMKIFSARPCPSLRCMALSERTGRNDGMFHWFPAKLRDDVSNQGWPGLSSERRFSIAQSSTDWHARLITGAMRLNMN